MVRRQQAGLPTCMGSDFVYCRNHVTDILIDLLPINLLSLRVPPTSSMVRPRSALFEERVHDAYPCLRRSEEELTQALVLYRTYRKMP